MKTFLTLLLLALFNINTFSQELIRWDFEDENGQPTLFPTFISDTSAMDVNDVRYSALYPLNGNPVPGVSGQSFDWANSVRGWYPDSSAQTYIWTWIEFRFFVDPSFVVYVDSVSLWYKRDLVGPTRFDFRSHKDLYSSAIDATLLDESDVSWHKWSIPVDTFLANGYEQVTFRIYGDGAISFNQGYFAIDSVAIFGSAILAQPLHLKAYLGGAFVESSPPQKDSLRSSGYIPIADPYGSGKLATSETFNISGDNAVVDWVVVEIRNPDDSADILRSVSAFLQKDGDIVNIDGTSAPVVDLDSGQYYIAVRHRNHLGVMTSSPVNLSDTTDFTLPETSVFGSNSRKQIGSSMFLWEGDVNTDGVVKYTGENSDRDQILQDIGGVTPTNEDSGYLDSDVNMDGFVRYTGEDNDRDLILLNIGGVVPTNTRSGTLP